MNDRKIIEKSSAGEVRPPSEATSGPLTEVSEPPPSPHPHPPLVTAS